METDVLAPVAYLAVEFPEGRLTGQGFTVVGDLVARGVIAVLDLEFIGKAADGSVSKVPLDSIDHDADVDIAQWQGAYSGLLDQDDVDAIASVMEPGALVGILVYENVWATPLLAAIDAHGVRVLGSGAVDSDDLVQALTPTDPA